MFRFLLVAILLVFATPGVAQDTTLAGVSLDQSLNVDGVELALNGAGIRKKLFFKLYVGSLYVDNTLKGADGNAIVQADSPMLIQLNILSDLLTRDKLIDALNEGFDKSTGGNTAPVQSEITTMIEALNVAIKPGHVYRIAYSPQTGTRVITGEETLATIDGLAFKQALFGIWLSEAPAQKSLKQAMLAQ
ncbi:MAG: chalcone isomerase family protein [Granulosicoccus sp.]